MCYRFVEQFKGKDEDRVEGGQIIDPVFETLSRFADLNSFIGELFTLSPRHVDCLSTAFCPSLTSLELAECPTTVNWNGRTPEYKLRNLSIKQHYAEGTKHDNANPWWVGLILPNVIQRIKLDLTYSSNPTNPLYTQLVERPGFTLTSLKYLSVVVRYPKAEYSCFVPALTKLPVLERLELVGPDSTGYFTQDARASKFSEKLEWALREKPEFLAKLSTIKAPNHIIIPIAKTGSLRNVYLADHQGSVISGKTTKMLVSELKTRSPHLVSISLDISRVSMNEILSYINAFRRLENVRITARKIEATNKDFDVSRRSHCVHGLDTLR